MSYKIVCKFANETLAERGAARGATSAHSLNFHNTQSNAE